MVSTSNKILPGLTLATQYSGEPLPLPILVSRGFFVIGLSGKILIHIFPTFLTLLDIEILVASICLAVIHPGGSFQFTETYRAPGMVNQTIIQRVTEIQSVTDTTSTFSKSNSKSRGKAKQSTPRKVKQKRANQSKAGQRKNKSKAGQTRENQKQSRAKQKQKQQQRKS